jgi:hypothetical protein
MIGTERIQQAIILKELVRHRIRISRQIIDLFFEELWKIRSRFDCFPGVINETWIGVSLGTENNMRLIGQKVKKVIASCDELIFAIERPLIS